MSASVRAKRFWEKLHGWYGSALTEQFGPEPPSDWCALVDDSGNDVVASALAEIRQRHVTFPPKFPEVDAIFAKLKRPHDASPSMMDLLSDYALRSKPLTFRQLRGWTFLYQGHSGYAGCPASHDYAVVGMVIPADGDAPGYRIMVTDMQLEHAA